MAIWQPSVATKGLTPDGEIVLADKQIVTSKCHLPSTSSWHQKDSKRMSSMAFSNDLHHFSRLYLE